MDFGRFLNSHLVEITNPFLSKDDSPPPSVLNKDEIFKNKDLFSDLYSDMEWDSSQILSENEKSTTDSIVDAKETMTPGDSLLKSQEDVVKLLNNPNWEADIRPEDVMATAEALAKTNVQTNAADTTTEGPTSFSDAFKSHDWSIESDGIADIEYEPDMLTRDPTASFSDAFNSRDWVIPSNDIADIEFNPSMLEHSSLVPPSKKQKVSNEFSSRDFLLKVLGTEQFPTTETDMMFDENESLNADVEISKLKPKTDWEGLMMSQLAETGSSSNVPTATVKTTAKPLKKKRKRKKRPKIVPKKKTYVTVSQLDVLLGRGGRSNHHPGNKRYREEVVNFRPLYASLETDKEKTDMSQRLVNVIEQFGGRFLEEDKVKDGKSWISLGWYVVPNIVARRKAGQALREDNDPEKRKAKRARFLAKKQQRQAAVGQIS